MTAPVFRLGRRPVGRVGGLLLTSVVLATPAWLFRDDLALYTMFGDDFAYVAGSLDPATFARSALAPHNGHVVPAFRLWTLGLVGFAGHLASMPSVLGFASYFGLAVTMAAVAWLVLQATGRPTLALAAAACLGVSTVVKSAVSWFSAGQALWAGAGIVATLILAEAWARRPSAPRFTLVILGVLAVPTLWSGGLVAGPAAIAYLLSRDPRRSRWLCTALAGASAAWVGLIVALSRQQIQQARIVWERHDELWPRPIQAVFHTAQAVSETLVLSNLGLDAVTTPTQAILIVAAIVAVWAWSRGRGAIHPLEAAGATIVVGGYLLVYLFRGNLPFSSVRPVVWYHLIPQTGAVLFLAGWWATLKPTPRMPFTYWDACLVLVLVVVLVLLQAPRVDRLLVDGAPAMSESEAAMFPVAELQKLRAFYFKEDFRARQIRALARLDRAGVAARAAGLDRTALRRVFAPVDIPGLPMDQFGADAFALLPIPEHATTPIEPGRVPASMGELFRREPDPRPPWLPADEPWPRR